MVRYCVSIDDGQEDYGDGERTHHANTVFLTGYAGDSDRVAPTNITLYNNLIVSTKAATQYYRFIDQPKRFLMANNEIVVGNGAIESLSTIGTDYSVEQVTARANMVGGNPAAMANSTALFGASGGERLDASAAKTYANDVASSVVQ